MDAANHTNAAVATTGKRKAEDINPAVFNGAAIPAIRIQPPYAPQYGVGAAAAVVAAASPKKGAATSKKKSKPNDSAKVQARLEANRKAARESRRRKKVLVEELQRSVIFFSRANGQLKQKNEELERMFIQAQAQIAARNGTTAAAAEGGQEVQQEGQVDETNDDPSKTEGDDGGAVKTNMDGGNDAAVATLEEDDRADVPQDDGLAATAGEQQQTADVAQTQQQQQEIANIPFPGMVQQPVPFAAVPGAPAMDPNTMMYMMMMSGNPLANPMLAANPMMALQMFNQLNAAGAIAGGIPNQQAQTQGANAAATTTAAAAAPTAFPAMPVGMGNVIMPTPGGAFNPFGGFAAAAGNVNPAAATTAEGDSSPAAVPNAAPDVTEELNV